MKLISHLLLLFFFIINVQARADAPVFYAKQYGLKADGKTDNYKAFVKLVDAINKRKGGTIVFEKGIYIINEFKNEKNNVQDFIYKDCNNLTIQGNGATIKLNNKFTKSIDRTKKNFNYSNKGSLIPFYFDNIIGLKISNLTVDGGNNNARKAKGLTEQAEHLFSFSNCTNVTINNLTAQNSLCDGFYIKNNNHNFVFSNVKALNNARQGLSIISLRQGEFKNCEFSQSGRSSYGHHAPAAGLDIEPNIKDAVKNITFTGCRFYNNMNAQIVISRPQFTENITVKNSVIDAVSSKYTYQMILSADNVQILNNKINLNTGSIYPMWGEFPNSKTTIRGNEIRSSGRGLVAAGLTNIDVTIESNQFIFTGTKLSSYFPYIQAPVIFKNNSILIPEAAKRNGMVSLIQNAIESSGNKFITESGKSFKSKVSYSKTKKVND